MSWFFVDVEADSQSPATGSMFMFGAVLFDEIFETTFKGLLIPRIYPPKDTYAYELSHTTPEEMVRIGHPYQLVMSDFKDWIAKVNLKGRPMFISDNNSYDYQWINYYFDLAGIKNPFGHSSTNLGSLYKGLVKSSFKSFKFLRKTVHDHDPVNDAKGNAEAYLYMKKEMGYIDE